MPSGGEFADGKAGENLSRKGDILSLGRDIG